MSKKRTSKKNSSSNLRIGILAILTLLFSTIFTFGTINTFNYYGINPLYLVIIGGVGLSGLLIFGGVYTLQNIGGRIRK